MKKRIAIYATAAIILGIAVMALPLTLQSSPLRPYGLTPQYAASPNAIGESAGKTIPSIFDIARRPVKLVPLCGILLAGLIVALCVYIILRRKTR